MSAKTAPAEVRAPRLNYLTAPCDRCGAQAGSVCFVPGPDRSMLTAPHRSRRRAAFVAAGGNHNSRGPYIAEALPSEARHG